MKPFHIAVQKRHLSAAAIAAAFILLLLLYSSTQIPITTTDSLTQHSDAITAVAPTAAPSGSSPTDTTHLLFNLAGSAATWTDRSQYVHTWWIPGRTRGHVWLDSEPKPSTGSFWLTRPEPDYIISSPDWTRFPFSSSQSAVRIARIVAESFNLAPPNIRWFVMGDDDTVFFPENLAAVLRKYDHTEMYYVGGISESVEQDVLHSFGMAFGGGGFAISHALAEELARILDGCLERFSNFYGSDQRVWACIAELGVSLTREDGFHQFDIRGNPYGILAAHPVAPLLSLHHLDAVEPIFPDRRSQLDSVKKLMEGYEADPGRILQRSFCYDPNRNWTMSVSWGYTVQLWLKVVNVHKLLNAMQTFRTWRSWSGGPFTFDTMGISPDPCEQPVVYFIDRVEERGLGESLSEYKLFLEKGNNSSCQRADYLLAMNVKSIMVAAPKMDLNDFQKAPRRHCCEIVEEGIDKNSTMKVHIRRCQRAETISNYLGVRN